MPEIVLAADKTVRNNITTLGKDAQKKQNSGRKNNMIINHNISSINAWRNTGIQNLSLDKSLEKLSSGLRVNRAADDAAGLAISEKMRSQIAGLNQAVRNAQDGISMIQTAEAAMNEDHAMLHRLRELAIQSANDTNTDNDRAHLQKEVTQLIAEMDRIASTTEFNTKKLLDGSTPTMILQIGANMGQTMNLSMVAIDSGTIGIGGANVATQAGASAAIGLIDAALSTVSAQRSTLGAVQNRLEHTVASLNVASENLQAAESRVRDADMAKEMTAFTKTQILVQAGTAMMAQSNQKPQSILKLLG
jgi:flagellin